jgi:hypothetical protein
VNDPFEQAMDRADARLAKIIDGVACHFPGMEPAILSRHGAGHPRRGMACHSELDGIADGSDVCTCTASAGA